MTANSMTLRNLDRILDIVVVVVVPAATDARLPPQKRSATLGVGVALSCPFAMRRKLLVLAQLGAAVPKLAPLVGTVIAGGFPVLAPLNQKGTPPFVTLQGVKHNWLALYSPSFNSKKHNNIKHFSF